jgi:hypothetical protein
MENKELEFLETIKTQVGELVEKGNTATKAEIDAIKAKLETINLKEVKDEVIELAKQVAALKEVGNKGENNVTLKSEIAKNKEALKSLPQGKELVLKATVTRASIANNAHAVDLTNIGQLGFRKLSAYDIFPKISVPEGNHNGTIRYVDWDAATIVRAAAMRAENTAFPESTAAFQTYTIPLQKIGDTLPVTEEFFEDEQLAASELEMFLRTNVEIVRDTQLVTGDGTGTNLTGVYPAAPTYTAAASGITDASIYDLLVKMKTSITSVYGSKYTPNFAFMNSTDIDKYKLKKDLNNNYVMPPFVSENGQMIDGITIIENNAITANTLVLGDNRYGRIYEMGGVSITNAPINAQFTSDLTTLKVRQRMLLLIRQVDKTGFLKCTSISAALTTLAS